MVNLGARAKHTIHRRHNRANGQLGPDHHAERLAADARSLPRTVGHWNRPELLPVFLISIGYGDVNEFGRFDQEDRKTFEMLAIDKGMEDRKVFKISRFMKHFAKAHQSGWLVGDEQGGTQPLYAPPQAQPQAGSSPQQADSSRPRQSDAIRLAEARFLRPHR